MRYPKRSRYKYAKSRYLRQALVSLNRTRPLGFIPPPPPS